MPFQQGEHNKETHTNINSTIDYQELDDKKVTSNEDEYKNILLSMISSLNKLDVSTKNNNHVMTYKNSSNINQFDW